MATEDNRMSGRVRRYARVGTSVGGLAARVAGQRYLGMPADSAKNAQDLRRALGGLKGPLMKVAQLLATIPDGLPDEYIEELRALQSNAPAMGWAFVKRRMAAELGADWRGLFGEFEQQAAAAASLGQVHRARGADGQDLACKLQYPDMASVVEADLRQLKLIFALYKRYDSAIDTREILHELTARLREELDYRREAGHLALYGAMLDGEDGVHVPIALPELSSGRLLTMSWLDGEALMDAVSRPQGERNRIAGNMFTAWYRPFYRYGVLHGDPHLGNYTIRDDGSVNLLDYGCVRIFPATFIQGVIDLYRSVQRDDRALMVHAFESWGFSGLSSEMVDALALWANYIYGPLTEDRARLIDESGSGKFGGAVAAEVHREVRRLGGVTPPREFVLLDRSAIGLGSVFLHLGAELNWHRAFEELIEGFESAALSVRQKEILQRSGVPEAA
ncbi:MAG: AarF/ABC1/UbiB kinase family protein [Rhodospirillaceae bacterium]|nr:AarF/ABC1/UbiB kinase family protein [Rhodospirillaceae bacterium]